MAQDGRGHPRRSDADVIGVIEIENDGYGPDSAIQFLVDQLNAATAPGTYAFIDADAGTGQVNALGTDAIKVGLLYKPAVVTPVGQTAALNIGRLRQRRRQRAAQPARRWRRPSRRTPPAARFVVVVNHLKSKGSACDAPDAGDGQGNCNVVRTNAADGARCLAGDRPDRHRRPRRADPGRPNSYAKEDPITALEDAGYTNLSSRSSGADAYSYVFDGQWGYLDHALASRHAWSRRSPAWPSTTSTPTSRRVLDYNTDFKTAGPDQRRLYAPDQFRISDHDPVLVGLDLVIPTTTALTIDPSTQQYSDTVTLDGVSPRPARPVASSSPSRPIAGQLGPTSADRPRHRRPEPPGRRPVADAAGTNVRFRAFFDGTASTRTRRTQAAPTVTKEDAGSSTAPATPVAAQVTRPAAGSGPARSCSPSTSRSARRTSRGRVRPSRAKSPRPGSP